MSGKGKPDGFRHSKNTRRIVMKKKIMNKGTQKQILAVMSMVMIMTAMGFADPSISTMVNNAVNLVFGLVAFGGIVNIVRGSATVARGLQDDGGGQDASAIIFNAGQGERIMINDMKPDGLVTAYAVNTQRDRFCRTEFITDGNLGTDYD